MGRLSASNSPNDNFLKNCFVIIDAHCHCYELGEGEELADKVLAVSDDYESSLRSLELGEKYPGKVIPCVGVHPWEIERGRIDDVAKVLRLVEERDVKCIGEVGLDKRFVPGSFEAQLAAFRRFLAMAREYDLIVNVHAPDAWREVLEELRKADVDRAVIHWYTGPLDLLDEIADLGYFIGINPAAKIQKKHVEVIKQAPRHIILTESDAPYDYRGLKLTPKLIRETIELIARLWGVSSDYVEELVSNNFAKLIG